MATILENESAWSATAATNANVDTGINWAEGQDAATVNNSARGMMAARAKARLDMGGGLAATGTVNALTVTTNQVLSSAHLAYGQRLLVQASGSNTVVAPTLAVDGLTAAPIRRADGGVLAPGDIRAGLMLDLMYNPGSGCWQAINLPGAVWATYTPAVSAGSGSFTATTPTGRYVKVGATVHFNVNLLIVTQGTAGSSLLFTLPSTAVSYAVFSGRNLSTGLMLQGFVATASASVTVTHYDNTFPGATDGRVLIVSGAYESST